MTVSALGIRTQRVAMRGGSDVLAVTVSVLGAGTRDGALSGVSDIGLLVLSCSPACNFVDHRRLRLYRISRPQRTVRRK